MLIVPDLLLVGTSWHDGHGYDLPTKEDLMEVCLNVRRAYAKIGAGSSGSGRSLILLTHYPAFAPDPTNKQESLRTYACLRELAAELKPVAIVQGHVHEWAGTVMKVPIGDQEALVVNPGPSSGILTIADGRPTWS